CGVGYNSIRFDDEVSRFGFYRNFIDPYAREWQNGNSRWDILDLVRMTYALRPEEINWPEREPGIPSFRLEHLTAANEIDQVGAHDALVDVRATIEIARLIKKLKPRLFDFYYELRRKDNVAELLNLRTQETVLHISGMFPATQGCISPVVPLLQHPINKNEIIVYDCRHDPDQILQMTAEDISVNLFTPNSERKEDQPRVALKGVHLNKSPALAPVKTLSPELAERWEINWVEVEKNRQKLISDQNLSAKLRELYLMKPDFGTSDADSALYEGFVSNDDRRYCDKILELSPEQLADWQPPFSDQRLQTLYSRYRARNWPETLNEEQQRDWQTFCHERLVDGEHGCSLTVNEFQLRMEELAQRATTEKEQKILNQLIAWVQNYN
ncbi:MAG: exodeoxyribonuclease I, partial [Gammaproteobacteria bacterium]